MHKQSIKTLYGVSAFRTKDFDSVSWCEAPDKQQLRSKFRSVWKTGCSLILGDAVILKEALQCRGVMSLDVWSATVRDVNVLWKGSCTPTATSCRWPAQRQKLGQSGETVRSTSSSCQPAAGVKLTDTTRALAQLKIWIRICRLSHLHGRMKVLLAHHVRCTGVDAHWAPLSRRWCCVRAANVALRSGFLCRDTVVQSLMALIRFPTRDQRLIRGGGVSRHDAQCTNYQECVSDFLRRARKSDPSTTLLTASPDQVIGLFMWQGCPSSKDVVYIPDVRRLQSILKKWLCMYVFKQP